MLELKDRWDALTPAKKSFWLKWGSAGLLLSLILFSYYFSGRDEKQLEAVTEPSRMDLGTEMLEEDIRAEVDARLLAQGQINQDDDLRLQALETLLTELQANVESEDFLDLGEDAEPASDRRHQSPYPPPPAVFPDTTLLLDTPPIEIQFIGAVARSNGTPEPKQEPEKKTAEFLMPPGFMQAKLLTGVEALTSAQGREDAEPLMFRVQAPAILPNDLKANLKGCFVIGNAYGSLAKERVEVRLVSLHCVAMDGSGVIDEDIKGFVVGKDGKKGLPGIVVSKMGALIARSMLAGIADGIGQAVTLNTVTQSVNPLGATSVVDPGKAFQAGIGQGIKTGAQKIQELYLELARQSGPVIESGAAADCTIVIQESVVLNIREWSSGHANL